MFGSSFRGFLVAIVTVATVVVGCGLNDSGRFAADVARLGPPPTAQEASQARIGRMPSMSRGGFKIETLEEGVFTVTSGTMSIQVDVRGYQPEPTEVVPATPIAVTYGTSGSWALASGEYAVGQAEQAAVASDSLEVAIFERIVPPANGQPLAFKLRVPGPSGATWIRITVPEGHETGWQEVRDGIGVPTQADLDAWIGTEIPSEASYSVQAWTLATWLGAGITGTDYTTADYWACVGFHAGPPAAAGIALAIASQLAPTRAPAWVAVGLAAIGIAWGVYQAKVNCPYPTPTPPPTPTPEPTPTPTPPPPCPPGFSCAEPGLFGPVWVNAMRQEPEIIEMGRARVGFNDILRAGYHSSNNTFTVEVWFGYWISPVYFDDAQGSGLGSYPRDCWWGYPSGWTGATKDSPCVRPSP